MAEEKEIPALTSVSTIGGTVKIKTQYIKDELPNFILAFISETVSSQDGVGYIEGELMAQMKNYPTEIDCYVDSNGDFIIVTNSGDADSYSLNSNGELIWTDPMTLVSKNLGLVRAIHSGLTAPSNIKMLWYNENVNLQYYYNTGSSQWEPLVATPWVKITKSYTDFATAALSNTAALYTLPAGYSVTNTISVIETQFLGGGAGVTETSIGTALDTVKFSGMDLLDLNQAPSETTQQPEDFGISTEKWLTSTDLIAEVTSDVNLSLLTQGSVSYYLRIEQVKQ